MSFHETLMPLVERAAAHTAHNWPSYVSAEDVAQEIWIWAYSRQNSIEKAMLDGEWEGKVYSTMLKAASAAASKEDRDTNNYSKEDTYTYTRDVIEVLLDSAFTHEDWQSFSTFGDGQPRAKGQVNETGDFMAMLSDVKAALAEIKKEYRDVLFLRHCAQLGFDEIGEKVGITQQGASKRHSSAVNALRDRLGRVSPADLRQNADDRHRAMGNGEARAVTDRQYEG
jgi:RNA polymerase sigma factor (sigma-70 family)